MLRAVPNQAKARCSPGVERPNSSEQSYRTDWPGFRVLKCYSPVLQTIAAMYATTPAVADHFRARGFVQTVASGKRQRLSSADSFNCGQCRAAERGPQLMPLLPRVLATAVAA